MKNELQNILLGNGEVKHGAIIQTIIGDLKGSQRTSPMAQKQQPSKKQETESLIHWIEKHQFWVRNINIENFVSAGAEQKVYLYFL